MPAFAGEVPARVNDERLIVFLSLSKVRVIKELDILVNKGQLWHLR